MKTRHTGAVTGWLVDLSDSGSVNWLTCGVDDSSGLLVMWVTGRLIDKLVG